jgi:hypothetical protein
VDQAAIFSISRTLTGALSFAGEASVAANPSSGPVGAGLGNSQGSGRNAAVAPPSGGEITRDNPWESRGKYSCTVLDWTNVVPSCHCHVPKVNPE